jgi:hypothetical protein
VDQYLLQGEKKEIIRKEEDDDDAAVGVVRFRAFATLSLQHASPLSASHPRAHHSLFLASQ